ncbi:unnamed protein product, partial [Ixodes persulcatus]
RVDPAAVRKREVIAQRPLVTLAAQSGANLATQYRSFAAVEEGRPCRPLVSGRRCFKGGPSLSSRSRDRNTGTNGSPPALGRRPLGGSQWETNVGASRDELERLDALSARPDAAALNPSRHASFSDKRPRPS